MTLTVAVDSIIIKEIPQQYHHFQNCFTILVVNDSNDVIFLRKKTILDYLEYISSVVWLPVKARTFKQSNIQSKQGLTQIHKIETSNVCNEVSTIQYQQIVINYIHISGMSHQPKE